MWEIICVVVIGMPLLFVAGLVWMCVIIAVLDAARTYAVGESKPLGKMLRRMNRGE